MPMLSVSLFETTEQLKLETTEHLSMSKSRSQFMYNNRCGSFIITERDLDLTTPIRTYNDRSKWIFLSSRRRFALAM